MLLVTVLNTFHVYYSFAYCEYEDRNRGLGLKIFRRKRGNKIEIMTDIVASQFFLSLDL